MLLILIPIAWLTIATFVVLLCRMAARSDAMLVQRSEQQSAPLPRVSLSARSRWHESSYIAGSRAARVWASRAPTLRTREDRCIAGS